MNLLKPAERKEKVSQKERYLRKHFIKPKNQYKEDIVSIKDNSMLYYTKKYVFYISHHRVCPHGYVLMCPGA